MKNYEFDFETVESETIIPLEDATNEAYDPWEEINNAIDSAREE